MNAKMKAMLGKFADAVDGFFGYVMTVVGVVLSGAIPLLKSGHEVTFAQLGLSWWKLVVGCFIALLIIGKSEMGGGDTPEARAAKRKNFWPRMGSAFAHGMTWSTILQVGS